MTELAKARIASAFGAAADYAAHAQVQRRVAAELARSITKLPAVASKPSDLRLLEIGCGTGFLTRAMLDRGLGGHWLVTDIAPAMLSRCARNVTEQDRAVLEFAAMDGERPSPQLRPGTFDVICSSLAFQWFADLPASLARLAELLAPGGVLAFSTLVAGTFSEWEQAHKGLGLTSGGLRYPGIEQLSASFPQGGTLVIREQVEREWHPDARSFLRSVKRIGAGTAPASRKPLSPAELRRVMAGFEASGAEASYCIAHCHWTRGRQQ